MGLPDDPPPSSTQPPREQFVQRLARLLRRRFPDQMAAYDDASLAAAVASSVKKAQAIGFRTELEIASMAEYVLVFGLNLEGEGARAVLATVGLSNMGKLRKLGEIALPRG
jgi:hypothetical protein